MSFATERAIKPQEEALDDSTLSYVRSLWAERRPLKTISEETGIPVKQLTKLLLNKEL